MCRTRYKWLEGGDQREGRKEVIVVILFMDHFAFSIAWSLFPPTNNSSFSEIIPSTFNSYYTHTHVHSSLFYQRRVAGRSTLSHPPLYPLTYPLSPSVSNKRNKFAECCTRNAFDQSPPIFRECDILVGSTLYTRKESTMSSVFFFQCRRLSSSVLCTVAA